MSQIIGLSDSLRIAGRPINYFPGLSIALDSIPAAILLSQLIYWKERASDDEGWIWKNREEFAAELGMSPKTLDGARAVLKENGLIEERYSRLNHRLEFRVIESAVDLFFGNRHFPKGEVAFDKKGNATRQKVKSFKGTETTTETTTENKPLSPFPVEQSNLPDWLPAETWQNFKQHRQEIKQPLTPRAELLAIKRLEEFKAQGHDPVRIVEESILNRWRGLFAPKESQKAPQRLEDDHSKRPCYGRRF